MKLLVLGCGTSTGVPRIGNDWGECDPDEPKNRRTRVSIMVESNAGSRLLVDTSPDLRQQLLDNELTSSTGCSGPTITPIIATGSTICGRCASAASGAIPGFASAATLRQLRSRFGYVFAGQYGYPTIVELNTLERLTHPCRIRRSSRSKCRTGRS